MDYEKVVHALIDPLIVEPGSVLIRATEEENGKDVSILIVSEKDDTARLIGRRGLIANSLREVISIAGKSENKHVHLKFESFEEERKED